MARILVWDWLVRVFHWAFAGGFAAAAVIALVLDEDSGVFGLHGVIGLVLVGMVVMRLVWGVVGTRYARFGSFVCGPGAVARYLAGVVTGTGPRHVGHNPASAWAILLMLGLMLGLGVTGVMMGMGKEGVKEVHEVMAYAMVGVVGVHIAGVVVHTLRFREAIALSMVTGMKAGEAGEGIGSAGLGAAAVFAAVTAVWGGALLKNYDSTRQTVRVPVVGTVLVIGEEEGEDDD